MRVSNSTNYCKINPNNSTPSTPCKNQLSIKENLTSIVMLKFSDPVLLEKKIYTYMHIYLTIIFKCLAFN